MDDSRPIIYRLDHCDRLIEWNDAFADFGAANGLELGPEELIGRQIWTFMSDSDVELLQRWLLDRVRQLDTPVRYRYRCDSPDTYRLLEMRMRPLPAGSVDYCSMAIEVRSLRAGDSRSSGLVVVCGWCDRICEGDRWLQLGSTVLEFDDPSSETNQVSHGICPSCSKALDRVATAPPPLPG